jgi:hypothetical protein
LHREQMIDTSLLEYFLSFNGDLWEFIEISFWINIACLLLSCMTHTSSLDMIISCN